MAAAAAVVVGTAIQMYGQDRAASAERKAANMQAALREAQAQEILRRGRLDSDAEKRTGIQAIGDQMAAQAGMGGSVTSGNLIMAQAELNYNNLTEIIRIQDEAEFQAMNVRATGQAESSLAKDRQRAARYQMAGTLMTSAYNYSNARGAA